MYHIIIVSNKRETEAAAAGGGKILEPCGGQVGISSEVFFCLFFVKSWKPQAGPGHLPRQPIFLQNCFKQFQFPERENVHVHVHLHAFFYKVT